MNLSAWNRSLSSSVRMAKYLQRYGGVIIHDCWASYLSYEHCGHGLCDSHLFCLGLHPEKSRMLEFGRYAQERRTRKGKGKPETFDFLGFTHYFSRARKNGWFKVEWKTITKRIRAQLKMIKTELGAISDYSRPLCAQDTNHASSTFAPFWHQIHKRGSQCVRSSRWDLRRGGAGNRHSYRDRSFQVSFHMDDRIKAFTTEFITDLLETGQSIAKFFFEFTEQWV